MVIVPSVISFSCAETQLRNYYPEAFSNSGKYARNRSNYLLSVSWVGLPLGLQRRAELRRRRITGIFAACQCASHLVSRFLG